MQGVRFACSVVRRNTPGHSSFHDLSSTGSIRVLVCAEAIPQDVAELMGLDAKERRYYDRIFAFLDIKVRVEGVHQCQIPVSTSIPAMHIMHHLADARLDCTHVGERGGEKQLEVELDASHKCATTRRTSLVPED